jgi:hypothetical protein
MIALGQGSIRLVDVFCTEKKTPIASKGPTPL